MHFSYGTWMRAVLALPLLITGCAREADPLAEQDVGLSPEARVLASVSLSETHVGLDLDAQRLLGREHERHHVGRVLSSAVSRSARYSAAVALRGSLAEPLEREPRFRARTPGSGGAT